MAHFPAIAIQQKALLFRPNQGRMVKSWNCTQSGHTYWSNKRWNEPTLGLKGQGEQ